MTEPVPPDGPPSLSLSDDELVRILGTTCYPGAADASIRMCIAYCRARKLDPLLKPVHIVPMNVKTGRGRDSYEWRDVVMPGIGLYRINAARTGLHAGTDEAVFSEEMIRMPGPGDEQILVHESCSVTVWKLVGGARVAFTAREFWLENYATAGRETVAPNAMWKRRWRGQIAKCAEAQALRKAFPEETGQQLLEGEGFDPELLEAVPTVGAADEAYTVARKADAPPAPALPAPAPLDPLAADLAARRPDLVPVEPSAPVDPFVAAINAAEKANRNGAPGKPEREPDGPVIGAGEVAYLKLQAKRYKVDLAAVLAAMGGLVLEKLSKADFERVKMKILNVGGPGGA